MGWLWAPDDIVSLDQFAAVVIDVTQPATGTDRQLWLDLVSFTWHVWWAGAWRPIGAAGTATAVGTATSTFPVTFSQAADGDVAYAGAVTGTATSTFGLTFATSAVGTSTTTVVGDATSTFTLTFAQSAAGVSVPTVTGTATSTFTVAFSQLAAGSVTGVAGWVGSVEALAPVHWWRFGETSGTVAGDEQAVQNGTYVGTVGRVAGLIPGDADGAAGLSTSINDYIDVPYNAAYNTGALTVAAVVQTTNTGIAMIAARDLESGVNRLWQFRLDTGGKLQGVWWNAAGSVFLFDSGTATFNDGLPHLVGLSINSTAAKLYADGQEVATQAGGTVRASASVTMRWGRTGGSSAVAFNGTIDEGMFDDRAWTAQEWADLFAASGL